MKKSTPQNTKVKKVVKVVKKVATKKSAKKAGVLTVSNISRNTVVAKKLNGKNTTVKKVAAKKVTASKKAKKPLVEAVNHNSFWMNDGQILNTLVALRDSLLLMDNAVYHYHTKNGRHDFANWVEDVLFDVDCAEALRKCKTPKSAHTTVVRYLKLYSF